MKQAVFGNFSMSSNRKFWAIYDDSTETFYRRNGYNGGLGAVIEFKSKEYANRKIKEMGNEKRR